MPRASYASAMPRLYVRTHGKVQIEPGFGHDDRRERIGDEAWRKVVLTTDIVGLGTERYSRLQIVHGTPADDTDDNAWHLLQAPEECQPGLRHVRMIRIALIPRKHTVE